MIMKKSIIGVFLFGLVSSVVLAAHDPLDVLDPKTPDELHYFLSQYSAANGENFFDFASKLYQSDPSRTEWSALQETALKRRILDSGGTILQGGCKTEICIIEVAYSSQHAAKDAGRIIVQGLAHARKTDIHPVFSAAEASAQNQLRIYAFSLENGAQYVRQARAQLKKPATIS